MDFEMLKSFIVSGYLLFCYFVISLLHNICYSRSVINCSLTLYVCLLQMPQTVPSGVYSTDTYAVYEDNFDLSLLPMDGEVPLSPHSQLSIELPPQTTDFTLTTIFDDITLIKTEKLSSGNWSIDNNQQQDSADTLQQYQHYSSPLPSPPQEYFVTVFPPSPAPSIELQPYQQQQSNSNNFTVIKQEFGLFPPSPPDSHGAPSPRCDVKGEPCDSSDTEACIDIDSLLQNSFDVFVPKRDEPDQQQDHQLLREYLQDTSFQRKHNLKPLALESLFGGWGARGDIEPVISLALEHAKKDVQQTCAALNISPGKFNSLYIILPTYLWLKMLSNLFIVESLNP